jgi:KipI family sensor histidine kinase inhibitor
LIEVPVCYDQSLGIDLEAAAKIANCNIEALIQEHTAHIYTVYCLGFLPGFAYMGDVPKKIQLPRHAKPRASVVAGSVGIAGKQTGIYPMDSPGGWQIIGRTPLKIFDTIKLSLFQAGDQVKFNPIDLALFHELNNQEDVH